MANIVRKQVYYEKVLVIYAHLSEHIIISTTN